MRDETALGSTASTPSGPAGAGTAPPRYLTDHGEGAAHQVPQVVCEFRVDPRPERFLAESGVEPEDHLTGEAITGGIHPEGRGEFPWADHVSETLGHLPLAHPPVAVDVDPPGRGEPERAEHCGPVNTVGLEYVLGYDVFGNGPKAFKSFVIRIADACEIVDEGVEPDVGHEVFVEREGNPPGKACRGPGNAEVLEGFAEKRKDLVAVAFGRDEPGVVQDMFHEPVLVAAHEKEIVLFPDEGGNRAVVRASSIHELPFEIEPLAPEAVEPLVFPEFDVPPVPDQGKDPADRLHMVRISSADEAVRFHTK